MKKLSVVVLAILLLVTGCSTAPPLALPDTQARDELAAGILLDPDFVPGSPVHNGYFTPREGASPALHNFSGTLRVDEFVMQDSIPAGTPRSENGRYFPGFEAEFFTYDNYLVPANREIMSSTGDKSRWRIILSPGRVWLEPGDEGWSRASFPFVMTSRTSNDAHNGLATFLYDDGRVSQFYFQITQETAAWNRNDYWGQTTPIYTPGPIADEAAQCDQFAAELAAQVPIRPWSDLESQVDGDLLAAFNGGLEPEDISAAGLIIDGVIYLQPSVTRHGEFPYPRAMRHGVFSVTKSMGAAVALLRLAQKYGDDVFDLKIADYVAVTAVHNGWEDVTFGNALSMATGIGDSKLDRTSGNVTDDEDQEKFSNWMEMDSATEKLAGAFEYGNYDWGPGEVVRYNSINTFVLGAAMDAFLKSKEGPDADIWQMVLEEVYWPIGIYHAPMMRTYEPDGRPGLPIFGYGLFPTVDDTAKITLLLHNGGRYDGEQLLSPTRLAEALYQTEEQGLPVNQRNQYGESRYLLSFWSIAYCTDDDTCFQAPYMMGYGGNLTMLLPNDVTAFRYADAHNYDPEPLADLGTAVRPIQIK
ncbi:MAG: serine hydrolase [Ardenticatenaceae bacterium]|nr:serine hydrolase [Ardenticatenaceae bacterium]MCB9446550.1 serine hydrolase [Ardenticatenaceae bacterium]